MILNELLTTLEKDDEYTIYNSRVVNWASFSFNNGFTNHYISKDEILKPYLISVMYYDTIDYEEILLLINHVQNPFDLRAGDNLKIPKLKDINQFILDNRK